MATEITNSTAINCNVKSVDNLELFKTQAGTNNTEGSTFTLVIPDATEIASEADFWKIYENNVEENGFLKITGTYVLTADITLSEVPANKLGTTTLHNFAGTLIGNGHTLTYGGSRLFAVVYGGTIKNIDIVLTSGCYLGSAIAFDIKNATFTDITMDVTFDTPMTYYGDFAQAGMGVLGVWMDATTVDNVDISIKLTGTAANNPTYFCGIAQNISNSTVTNCDITAPADIGLSDSIDAATVTTGSSVTVVA